MQYVLAIHDDGKANILIYKWADTFQDVLKHPNAYNSQDSTNWCGSDDIHRVLKLTHKRMAGAIITLKEPFGVRGQDYDMGHTYDWKVKVVKICELKEMPEEQKEREWSVDVKVDLNIKAKTKEEMQMKIEEQIKKLPSLSSFSIEGYSV